MTNDQVSREYPKHPMLGVSCAVWHSGRVLLVRRGKPPRKDWWALPGGLVETGETCIQAICREIHEETGLDIADPVFCDMKEIIRPDGDGRIQTHFVLMVYAAHAPKDDVQAGDDAAEAIFVRPDMFDQFALLPGIADSVTKSRSVLEV